MTKSHLTLSLINLATRRNLSLSPPHPQNIQQSTHHTSHWLSSLSPGNTTACIQSSCDPVFIVPKFLSKKTYSVTSSACWVMSRHVVRPQQPKRRSYHGDDDASSGTFVSSKNLRPIGKAVSDEAQSRIAPTSSLSQGRPHHHISSSVARGARQANPTKHPSTSLSRYPSTSISKSAVIERLENLMVDSFLSPLAEDNYDEDPAVPTLEIGDRAMSFSNDHQCRGITSILLVACFCHRLLMASRTATTREVYYYYVTHFFHQRECETAIWDLTILLGLTSRHSLGLSASPRGWFCGSVSLYNSRTGELYLDGRDVDAHGISITPATYGNPDNIVLLNDEFQRRRSDQSSGEKQDRAPQLCIESDALYILVIEKEGVYMRLSEDRIFEKIPCILVTGKGFPDVATRQWVHHLQHLLKIPALGLCDCNPYGISVLNTYQYEYGAKVEKARQRATADDQTEVNGSGEEPTLELQWIGLRPSQVKNLDLPRSVFQELSRLDKKRLATLLDENHPFAQRGWNPERRRSELQAMDEFKVELEALHWLGMDYLSHFVVATMRAHANFRGTDGRSATDGDRFSAII
jgi:meiotic recombination protein SPO11